VTLARSRAITAIQLLYRRWSMDPNEVRLLAEQYRRTLDLLNGRIDALQAQISHQEEIKNLRLSTLEHSQADQEARLRAVADSVVRLTTSASLAQIFQAAFALALSALAAWLGSR
jgi:uncharacterized coiled-coil protein SlyX